jgi:hypothetical protein
MIPGPHWGETTDEDQIILDLLVSRIERRILASGQIPCPRPHQNLWHPTNPRCYCGAQV